MEPNDDEFFDDLMEKVKNLGHNSLSTVVKKAKAALVQIQKGEGITWEGWRDYGKALNEGKGSFTETDTNFFDKKGFGQWVADEGLDKFYCNNLLHYKEVTRPERAAAMWIAESPKEEQEALELFPNARTPRGLYDKWNEHLKKLEEGDIDDTGDSDDDDTETNITDDKDDVELPDSGNTEDPSKTEGSSSNVISLKGNNKKEDKKPKGSGNTNSSKPVEPPKADIGLIASSMFGVVTNVQTFKNLSDGNAPTTKQVADAIMHEIKHVQKRETEEEIRNELESLKETITLVSQALEQMTNNVTPLNLVN